MSAVGRFILFKMPALLYMGLIFYLSSAPVPAGGLWAIPDYVLHTVEYCGLYLLLHWAVHEGILPVKGRGGYWLPLAITVLYAISDEWHQSYVVSRHASSKDVAADAVGALIGIGVMLILRSVLRRRKP